MLALREMGSAPGGTETVRLKSSWPTDELLLPRFTKRAGSDRPLACAYLQVVSLKLNESFMSQCVSGRFRKDEGCLGSSGASGKWLV